MARVRIRQHVNPLSSKFRKSISLPPWDQVYANLSQAFHLDLGCARGRFLLEMAQVEPDRNYLGVEIREPLVIEANQIKEQQQLSNLHYLFANINYSLTDLLSSLPPQQLKLVSIQFPDPWFKKKHQKRRVVQPEIVNIIRQFIADDGQIFLQSDVKEVAEQMCELFLTHPNFGALSPDIWLDNNPLPVQTEREIATINKGQPVYRTVIIPK